uniref:BOS complex subunit NCLN n=1 Tax=Fundulus heteroclitus TaxID=8078 RepID=A0A3Q2NZ55_FUNHE
MFEEASEVFDNMFKSSFPLTFIVFIPAVLILVSPLPAEAAHEFTVYRMQQYDLQGQAYGTRNAILNTEARTVEAEVLSRRCVIMRLADFSYDKYQKALRQSAGAVVIILPKNMSAMPQDIVQQFMELEPEMLATETIVPVYFAEEDNELLSIYTQTLTSSSSQGSLSAAEVLLHTATANGFQMVTSGAQSKAISDWAITSLEGRLTGVGGEDLPTIVVVAHYDTFGVAPWLSYGADSNGSGVSMLLELARLFSKLYTYKRTHAAYNLLFFVSGGGKFNYQGTKRWLEDNLDHTDSSLLQDNVAFVLCLDTLGNGDSLYLHVSKPPKEGTPQYSLLKELETVVASQHPEVKFSMVHKKINLAEDMLAWEHERFGIRRLPAFTLSHLPSHRSAQRSSIMDVRSVSPSSRHGAGEPPAGWVHYCKSHQYPKRKHFTFQRVSFPSSSLVMALPEQPYCNIIKRLHKRCSVKVRLRWQNSVDDLHIFASSLKLCLPFSLRVKPAIFDLLLAFCIAAYLGMMYLAIQNFGLLYSVVRRITLPKAKVH